MFHGEFLTRHLIKGRYFIFVHIDILLLLNHIIMSFKDALQSIGLSHGKKGLSGTTLSSHKPAIQGYMVTESSTVWPLRGKECMLSRSLVARQSWPDYLPSPAHKRHVLEQRSPVKCPANGRRRSKRTIAGRQMRAAARRTSCSRTSRQMII